MIKVTKKNPVRMLSLFSGIGAFEKALTNLGIPYTLVNYCEIDRYASTAFSAIHGVPESLNLKDVTKVDTSSLTDLDLITYGFPCQDISNAGKRKGFTNEDGTTTRSGLFFEALRIITDTQPKIAIAENVKGLVGDKFTQEFYTVLSSLFDAGYNSYFCVLNAKDYGVPQNRERVFIVSARKDIDFTFTAPEPIPLTRCLRDLCDKEVDEKYYLSDKMLKHILCGGTGSFWSKPELDRSVAHTLTATMHKMHRSGTDNYVSESFIEDGIPCDISTGEQIELRQVAQLVPGAKFNNPERGRVYDDLGLCPTLNTVSGGGLQPKILVKENTQKGYAVAEEGDSINFERATANTRRGRVGKGISNTILAEPSMAVVTPKMRVRRLTPLECFRLMGFTDEDYRRIPSSVSDTQRYHMAGNSIVVDVLMALFRQIYTTEEAEN